MKKENLGYLGDKLQLNLLSSILTNTTEWLDYIQIIEIHYFQDEKLRLIFSHIKDYYEFNNSIISFEDLELRLRTEITGITLDYALGMLKMIKSAKSDVNFDDAKDFFNKQHAIKLADEIKAAADKCDFNKVNELSDKLVNSERKNKKLEFKFFEDDEISEEDYENRRGKMLFGNLIYKGETTILFGNSNSGKSIIGAHILDEIANGNSGFENECGKQRVLWCSHEMNDDDMISRFYQKENGKRVRKLNKDVKILKSEQLVNLDNISGKQGKFYPYSTNEFKKMLTDNFDVVLVDNLSSCSTELDFEKAKDAKEIILFFNKLGIETNTTFILVAHTTKAQGKGNNLDENNMAGSKQLQNLVGSIIGVGAASNIDGDDLDNNYYIYTKILKTRKGVKNDYVNVFKLKTNDYRKEHGLAINVEYVDYVREIEAIKNDSNDSGLFNENYFGNYVKTKLAQKNNNTVTDTIKELGINRASYYERLKTNWFKEYEKKCSDLDFTDKNIEELIRKELSN